MFHLTLAGLLALTKTLKMTELLEEILFVVICQVSSLLVIFAFSAEWPLKISN